MHITNLTRRNKMNKENNRNLTFVPITPIYCTTVMISYSGIFIYINRLSKSVRQKKTDKLVSTLGLRISCRCT